MPPIKIFSSNTSGKIIIGLIFFLAFFVGAFISRDPKTYIFMFGFVCALVILALALLSHIS